MSNSSRQMIHMPQWQVLWQRLHNSVLVYLQARVDAQMVLGFFEHMLTLPYTFFQQRSSGDLLSRLSSNLSIRDVLTNQLIVLRGHDS